VGLFKTLFKLTGLIVVGAVIAGIVAAVKRPKDGSPVSFEEWPNVPRNPEA
jgi:hypothetical protein